MGHNRRYRDLTPASWASTSCFDLRLIAHSKVDPTRHPLLVVTYLASIDQYTCITAKRYAVLTPNSIIPLTASRPPIICQGRCNVSPDAPSVAIESKE